MAAEKVYTSESFIDRETKLFKRFCLISLGIHLVVVTVDLSRYIFWNKSEIQPMDMVIPFELLEEFMGAPAEEKAAPELSVNEQILPQLPKNFKLEGEKLPEEEMAHPELKKEEVKKEEVKKKDEDKDLIEISKKEALARLLKEQARKEKKFKDETVVLSKALKERHAALQDSLSKNAMGIQLGYIDVMRSWIKKKYQLPDAYDLKSQKLDAVVTLILNKDGEIEKLSLHKSSNNNVFDQLAVKAVKDSAPYPTPPDDWVGRVITIPISVSNL